MEATFCFVDMAGFTALTEAHGDDEAARFALRLGELVDHALGDGGRVVKTIGDAVMAVAPAPDAAVTFVQRLWQVCASEPDFPVLRAGLHHGEAVERGADVFGAAVNLAARVTARASGGQVLATSVVADAARAHHVPVASLGAVLLRHVRQPVELFSLDLSHDRDVVVDPVCRMRVAPESAAGQFRVDGVDYWFCSLQCARAFLADPLAYRRDVT
jgi:class 3 adenylate cyclase/YHS domain-containing protein